MYSNPYNNSGGKYSAEEIEELYQLYLQKGTATWKEFASICNERFGRDNTADAYRKLIFAYNAQRDISPTRELQMAKQVFRDERNAWNKQNREQARTEYNIAMLKEHLEGISNDLFPDIKTMAKPEPMAKRSMLVLLTDWHIGAAFDGIFGRYDSDIARDRVEQLLKAIYKQQMLYRCEKCYIMTLGDLINGAIRRTVQVGNRETVIEQIKIAAELISNFCYSLCEIFPSVVYTGCAGNHSRLVENKESAVKDDRLDSIIDWSVGLFLKNVNNFEQIDPLDTTLTRLKIYDQEVWGVHGDYDSFSKGGLQNLCGAMRRFPDFVCAGHMHSPALQEADGVMMIRGGSLSGSGDDYTTQKRLNGKASQTVCIISPDGLEAVLPVFFD